MDDERKNKLLAQLRAAVEAQLGERSKEREIAIEKMQALGARDDDAAIQTLLSYLTQEDNELLRPLAASRLGEIGSKIVLDALIHLLETTNSPQLQLLVVQIFAEICDAAATPILITTLNADSSSDIRERAALAIGKSGGTGAFEALMQALDTEEDPKLRQQIVAGLGWLKDARAIPDLVRIMQTDHNKETQTFAAEALGRIGSQQCYIPLLDTLQNQEFLPIVRYYAAYALGLLGDVRAIVPLTALVSDESDHAWVRQMAHESLEKLQED